MFHKLQSVIKNAVDAVRIIDITLLYFHVLQCVHDICKLSGHYWEFQPIKNAEHYNYLYVYYL